MGRFFHACLQAERGQRTSPHICPPPTIQFDSTNPGLPGRKAAEQ
jgi:hypothetical protein